MFLQRTAHHKFSILVKGTASFTGATKTVFPYYSLSYALPRKRVALFFSQVSGPQGGTLKSVLYSRFWASSSPGTRYCCCVRFLGLMTK